MHHMTAPFVKCDPEGISTAPKESFQGGSCLSGGSTFTGPVEPVIQNLWQVKDLLTVALGCDF
jgi:hypothetical protein